MKNFKVFAPAVSAGGGIEWNMFKKGLKKEPDLIVIDPGAFSFHPYYLGRGRSSFDKNEVKEDLRFVLNEAINKDITVIIGNVGGAGAWIHVKLMEDIIYELGLEMDLTFSLASINSQVDKDYIRRAFWQGKIMPLAHNEELTEEEIKNSKRIVVQMGIEPIQEAYKRGGQVIVAGRAYSPALYGAIPFYKGFSPGLSYHMGRILEQGKCMFANLSEEELIIESLDDRTLLTPEYAAELSFFSNSGYIDIDEEKNLDISPYRIQGPGGIIDFTDTRFYKEEDNKVKIKGTRFVPREKNRLRLEGAKLKGYKTHSLAGVKNPLMIKEIDVIIEDIKRQVDENFNSGIYDYDLNFGFSGLTGFCGDLNNLDENYEETDILELGLIIETIADSQELADNITKFVKSTLHHYDYEGRVVTAENSVLPNLSPKISSTEVYELNICHLLEVEERENTGANKEANNFEANNFKEDKYANDLKEDIFAINIKDL